MRVALVHDWLVAQRGGENVLLAIADLFPDAPIFTLVHRPGRIDAGLEAHRITTSFIQRLPGAPRRFRQYLPLFPRAIESFDLGDFDLVISTSHCVAKGVRTVAPRQRHVSYIHTPMRYVWDQMPQYLAAIPFADRVAPVASLMVEPLRAWDIRSATRPDLLLANSDFVRHRIESVWQRPATVLHPPVDVGYFAGAARPRRRSGFLVVSALVPYKRVDLAVRAATVRGLDLKVVGEGSELTRLSRLAGPTVELIPALSRADLRAAYASAEALLFCGVEDFGIVPVEAMAAGCPVIAFAQGGVTETVVGDGPNATGVFFQTQTLAALERAIDEFQRRKAGGAFSPGVLAARARCFDKEAFIHGFLAALAHVGCDVEDRPERRRSALQ